MRIGKIDNTQFQGTLYATEEDRIVQSVDTENISTIKLNVDEGCVEISETVVTPPKTGLKAIFIKPLETPLIETYQRVLQYYTAACQNKEVWIEVPEWSAMFKKAARYK